MKLYPKCHPYWEIDGEKIKNPKVQNISYTAEGYLLPCCWCDQAQKHTIDQFKLFGLFDEDLKVSNVDNIEEEILKSPEWYYFHETLVHNPNDAPSVCKRKCHDPDDYLQIIRKKCNE